jgi:hypothetical protein
MTICRHRADRTFVQGGDQKALSLRIKAILLKLITAGKLFVADGCVATCFGAPASSCLLHAVSVRAASSNNPNAVIFFVELCIFFLLRIVLLIAQKTEQIILRYIC